MSVRFNEEAVWELAMRRNGGCSRQYAAFDEADRSELIAVIDEYDDGRAVVREVGSVAPDVCIPHCTQVTGPIVARALDISPKALLVQQVSWGRLAWFYETDAGRGLRPNRVA